MQKTRKSTTAAET